MDLTNMLQQDRHAYLIIAHNNFRLLSKLLSALDDTRNDIYIHIDKKASMIPWGTLKASVSKARLMFIKRQPVNWGGDSQIYVELALLQQATKSPHSYYHLISGVDFPLKSQEEIHYFFHKNAGKQFISVDQCPERMPEFKDRIRYYYPLQNRIGRNKGKHITVYEYIQNMLLKIQRKIRIDRLKGCSLDIRKGANWFSITHELALELLEQRQLIDKFFAYSKCADELFLQTIAFSSRFKEDIVGDNMRMVDWTKGNPYTFQMDDYERLITSGCIFARKFDERTDMKIVEKLDVYIHSQSV